MLDSEMDLLQVNFQYSTTELELGCRFSLTTRGDPFRGHGRRYGYTVSVQKLLLTTRHLPDSFWRRKLIFSFISGPDRPNDSLFTLHVESVIFPTTDYFRLVRSSRCTSSLLPSVQSLLKILNLITSFFFCS